MTDRLTGIIRLHRYYKMLTEKSIGQIEDQQVHQVIEGFDHSIAVLMKHISGYANSTWTNFRTEDGEKPWRDREGEFTDHFINRNELLDFWEKGWNQMLNALESIQEEELDNIIYVRNEGHTVLELGARSLAHISYHTGQIVMIAKYFAGENWQSLSIPKGKTEEYNKEKFNREKSIGFYKDRLQ